MVLPRPYAVVCNGSWNESPEKSIRCCKKKLQTFIQKWYTQKSRSFEIKSFSWMLITCHLPLNVLHDLKKRPLHCCCNWARTISVPTRSHSLFLLFFCNDICIHSMCLKRDFVESVCVFQAFDGTSFDDRSDFWRTHSKALASKKNH